MTLAKRIHEAYTAYQKLESELYEAIETIVGEGRLADAHVEYDSQYDNSVEVVLCSGIKLTIEERTQILALGFDRIWNDERSQRQ